MEVLMVKFKLFLSSPQDYARSDVCDLYRLTLPDFDLKNNNPMPIVAPPIRQLFNTINKLSPGSRLSMFALQNRAAVRMTNELKMPISFPMRSECMSARGRWTAYAVEIKINMPPTARKMVAWRSALKK